MLDPDLASIGVQSRRTPDHTRLPEDAASHWRPACSCRPSGSAPSGPFVSKTSRRTGLLRLAAMVVRSWRGRACSSGDRALASYAPGAPIVRRADCIERAVHMGRAGVRTPCIFPIFLSAYGMRRGFRLQAGAGRSDGGEKAAAWWQSGLSIVAPRNTGGPTPRAKPGPTLIPTASQSCALRQR